MAGDARKDGIIIGVGMAIAAGCPSAGVRSAVYRELCVVEHGSAPRGGRMALRAHFGKCGGHVIGIGDAVVFLRMAGITIGRSARVYP